MFLNIFKCQKFKFKIIITLIVRLSLIMKVKKIIKIRIKIQNNSKCHDIFYLISVIGGFVLRQKVPDNFFLFFH